MHGFPAELTSFIGRAGPVREVTGVLLVLDNCEHMIAAVAELCAGLLLMADDVRILATSREPLRVAGEARYRLAPMVVPEPDDLANAAKTEAVALFADRARSADTHFTLTDDTAPEVARLVTRLDGMPLAIELAAARVEASGMTGLLDRMDDRFALLAGADRLAPARHRSLAATVEWSYQLLNEQEQQVFRAVSVFRHRLLRSARRRHWPVGCDGSSENACSSPGEPVASGSQVTS